MNEFKVNLIFNDDEVIFQSLMNDLFIQYLKNQINTCNNGKIELSYIQ